MTTTGCLRLTLKNALENPSFIMKKSGQGLESHTFLVNFDALNFF